jgi:hypothetical protein
VIFCPCLALFWDNTFLITYYRQKGQML